MPKEELIVDDALEKDSSTGQRQRERSREPLSPTDELSLADMKASSWVQTVE